MKRDRRLPLMLALLSLAALVALADELSAGYQYFGRAKDKTLIVTNAVQAVETALEEVTQAAADYTDAVASGKADAEITVIDGDYWRVSELQGDEYVFLTNLRYSGATCTNTSGVIAKSWDETDPDYDHGDRPLGHAFGRFFYFWAFTANQQGTNYWVFLNSRADLDRFDTLDSLLTHDAGNYRYEYVPPATNAYAAVYANTMSALSSKLDTNVAALRGAVRSNASAIAEHASTLESHEEEIVKKADRLIIRYGDKWYCSEEETWLTLPAGASNSGTPLSWYDSEEKLWLLRLDNSQWMLTVRSDDYDPESGVPDPFAEAYSATVAGEPVKLVFGEGDEIWTLEREIVTNIVQYVVWGTDETDGRFYLEMGE